MLLPYLMANFLEHATFAEACGLSQTTLEDLIAKGVMPSASYVFECKGRSLSFVSDHSETAKYRFHLTGHTQWAQTVSRLGIDDEIRARRHFFHRYEAAKEVFLGGPLGRRLVAAAPDVPEGFDGVYADATWENFKSGVYGVCTRDGCPETVFLKQAGVMFIEALTIVAPSQMSGEQVALLIQAVDFLDMVESDFAPHEVALTSRQRCIIDIRDRYLPATQC